MLFARVDIGVIELSTKNEKEEFICGGLRFFFHKWACARIPEKDPPTRGPSEETAGRADDGEVRRVAARAGGAGR